MTAAGRCSAASTGWRLVLGLGAISALIGLVLHTQMPESPRWLLRHGRYAELRKAMANLGVRDVSDGDMLQLVMSATEPAHLADSGIGQSVIALAQAGQHHHVLTITLASRAREVAAKRSRGRRRPDGPRRQEPGRPGYRGTPPHTTAHKRLRQLAKHQRLRKRDLQS